jgi:hypothetical protein
VVRGASDGPRISQDLGNTRTNTPDEAKSPEKLTLPQLNGILSELGLGTLGGDEEKFVHKGKAEDTPRQDGAVRNRSDGVKSFFKGIGQGIGSFLSKIGNAFSNAFEAIKEAVSARIGGQANTANIQGTQNAPTTKALDKQGQILKEFCEELGKSLEKGYQDYLANTQDDPPMGRTDFVKQQLPDPQGGRDGIDQNSMGHIGDRIDDVRTNISDVVDPGLNEMRHAVLDRLTEMPSVEIATTGLFNDELKALDTNAATFLRTDSPYTKLDKFVARESIPFATIANTILTSVGDQVQENGHLGNIDGRRMAMNSLTKEQGVAVLQISDSILQNMLDTDGNNPDSLISSIPQSYRDFLSEKANVIMGQTDVSLQDRQDAVKTLYVNSLFLRGMSGDLTATAVQKFPGSDNQTFMVQTMQYVQSFLNGLTAFPMGKGNDVAQEALQQTIQTHQPRLEAFLLAVGMPEFGANQTIEDQKTGLE